MSEKENWASLALEAGTYETRLTTKFMRRKPYAKADPRVIKALIPGVVAVLDCEVGQPVRQGDTLMILEAMKMLNRIKAPQDGNIKTICVAAGEKISKDQVLIEIE